jgi:hypothetical protein
MNEQWKDEARVAGKQDKEDGLACVPYRSERFKALVATYPKFEKRILDAYVTAHQGYKLDVSKLRPFTCNFG